MYNAKHWSSIQTDISNIHNSFGNILINVYKLKQNLNEYMHM